MLLGMTGEAFAQKEQFKEIGTATWEDPFYTKVSSWGSETPLAPWEVKVKKSTTRKGVYAINPYNVKDVSEELGFTKPSSDIIIHMENLARIYFEPFSVNGEYKRIQFCTENGTAKADLPKYFHVSDNTISIESSYFGKSSNTDPGNLIPPATIRTLRLTLPDECFESAYEDFDGILMGITSFSDNVSLMPMTSLDNSTANDFKSFVNNMQTGGATLLYYGVDTALDQLSCTTWVPNLNHIVHITFTDGLDQGSLAIKPEMRDSKNYANHLSTRIKNMAINSNFLQAYAIGLKSESLDEDEFTANLRALASGQNNAYTASDIDGVQDEMERIVNELCRQIVQTRVTFNVPFMSHGKYYRFTFDGVTSNNVEDSQMWAEGRFDIDDMTLKDVTYHGFTCTSSDVIELEQNGVYLSIPFEDCRDMEGNNLNISLKDIRQWEYKDAGRWDPNIESDNKPANKVEKVKSSAAILLTLDCSSSLGDKFSTLKATTLDLINRLLDAKKHPGAVETIEDDFMIETSDLTPHYYTITGVEISADQLHKGLYIVRQGSESKKIMIR